MEYYSCYFLEQMYLTFKGRIDDKYSSIALCCETTEGAPTIPYEETPEETLKNIVDKWKQIMEDSQQYMNTPPRVVSVSPAPNARSIEKRSGNRMG